MYKKVMMIILAGTAGSFLKAVEFTLENGLDNPAFFQILTNYTVGADGSVARDAHSGLITGTRHGSRLLNPHERWTFEVPEGEIVIDIIRLSMPSVSSHAFMFIPDEDYEVVIDEGFFNLDGDPTLVAAPPVPAAAAAPEPAAPIAPLPGLGIPPAGAVLPAAGVGAAIPPAADNIGHP